MRGRYHMKAIILVLALLLLLPYHPSALAARPDDAPEKGSVPACSLVLNSETVAESDSYDLERVDVSPLYIGLLYDRDAVYEAEFANANGMGFQIGSFDEQRSFHPSFETAASELLIRIEREWYVMMDELFSTKEDAAAVSERYWGRVIEYNGDVRVLIGPFKNIEEVEYTIRWYGLAAQPWRESCLAVYDGDGRLLELYAGADELAIEAISEAKPHTYFNGEQYDGAFLLRRWDGNRLTVINVVELEDYVKGVIPYEMSPSWPVEALKAQAVCARTYAAYNRNAYAEDYGFDLTDDTESQVYRGINGADAVTDAAVEATRGQFVRYQGQLCEIYYFASDGGSTEDGAHVFGSDRPYLAGKTDPFEPALDFAVMRWERWRGGEEIAWRLRQKGYAIDSVAKIEPVYSELGNVIGMRYYGSNGECVALDHRDSYSLLSLDSGRFTVAADYDGFRFTGIGWGHNCGMSQWGANAMAAIYGYTADDIIRFYFTGAYIG